jgi:hypothetical protein
VAVVAFTLAAGILSPIQGGSASHAGARSIPANGDLRPSPAGLEAGPRGTAGPSPTSGVPLTGPHLAAWGPRGVPPGAPPAIPRGASSSQFAADHCNGLWPGSGQGTYAAPCYGHDEPGISFYSTLPGSGGNVTWNVTLPVDRSATANQSDLYSAVWFGLTLHDPLGWLDQCYLELQLYPDSSWSQPTSTVNGNWVGAAVGWQLDVTNGGYEDLCLYDPLYIGGNPASGFFNMAQGDALTVQMTGWAGSPYGENISLIDATSGQSSSVNLFDPQAGVPLDPAYATNSWSDSLQWTPGGELPATFAFEVGHAGNPDFPANSSLYSGCSPGAPPSTPQDPAVPCPSYDPSSWVNDTAEPWKIQPPLFGNGASTARPGQVDFTQDFGGASAILSLSNNSCQGREGSGYCSYPWFSYSCGAHAFEFGATDYPGVSQDFGEYNEYTTVNTSNDIGVPFYAPSPWPVPACGGSAYALTLSAGPGGTANCLGSAVSNGSVLVGSLLPGTYSLYARAAAGKYFAGWLVSGGALVDRAEDPLATLTISAAGSVQATFRATPPSATDVWFNDTDSGSAVEVYPGTTYSNGTPWATVADGGHLALPPGLYTLEANPPIGANFTRFSTSGTGVGLASDGLPVTWLWTSGNARTAGVELTTTASPSTAALNVSIVGKGTVSFGSYTATPSGAIANISVPVGTYSARATASPGWTFLGWTGEGTLVQSDFQNATNITLEAGNATVLARFGAQVTIAVGANATAGDVLLNGLGPYPNGTVPALSPGIYKIDAFSAGNESFVQWTVSDPAALWVFKPTGSYTHLEVNGSGTVTALFSAGAGHTITFDVGLPGAATLLFNGATHYAGNATNRSVANGSYLLSQTTSPGFRFLGWNTTGAVSASNGVLAVHGNGTVVANYAVRPFPVSFIAGPPSEVLGVVAGVNVSTGATLELVRGTYPISVTLGPNDTFAGWTSNLAVSQPSSISSNVTVNAPGTITALVAPFIVVGLSGTSSTGEVGLPTNLSVYANGSTGFTYAYSGLPQGCRSRDSPHLTCIPQATGTFTLSATITGGSGFTATTAPWNFTVVPRPSVASFASSSAVIESGAPVWLNASVVGGIGPYSASYSGLPSPCASADSLGLLCRPTTAGSATVEISVRDAAGAVAYANVTFSVVARPTVSSFGASPPEFTVGASTLLGVIVAGGQAPYSYLYSGLPSGCSSVDAPSLRCTAQAAGVFHIFLIVHDSAGYAAYGNLTLVVNTAPAIAAFLAEPSNLTEGQSVSFVLNASGGTGALNVTYFGLPSGCSTANVTVLTCTPTTAGTYRVTALVTDRDGISTSASTQIVVGVPATTAGGSASPSEYLVWILGATAVAAAALALFVWRIRHVRPPSPRSSVGKDPFEDR